MELICLVGLNGSGKSTTAKNIKDLIEEKGHTAFIESFATPLKIIAERHCKYNERKKNSGHRKILEDLALTIKEQFGQGVFAYALMDRIKDRTEEICIIDDLRFVVELTAINQFYPIRIIVMPFVSNCDGKDFKRLQEVLTFLSCHGAPYSEIEDLEIETLRTLLFDPADAEEIW